jgi:hypothetical protein
MRGGRDRLHDAMRRGKAWNSSLNSYIRLPEQAVGCVLLPMMSEQRWRGWRQACLVASRNRVSDDWREVIIQYWDHLRVEAHRVFVWIRLGRSFERQPSYQGPRNYKLLLRSSRVAMSPPRLTCYPSSAFKRQVGQIIGHGTPWAGPWGVDHNYCVASREVLR